MSVVPALRRLRQKYCDLEVSLGYTERTCLKTNAGIFNIFSISIIEK
jgi:hypothetical protein